MSRFSQFRAGAVAAIPVILGYIPVGIAYGIMALNSGLSPWQTMNLSLFVYTGAGQMATARMIGMQTAYAVILLTVTLMNLRHLIMSTVVMEKLRSLPLFRRIGLSFFITDETFAVFSLEDEERPSGWYFFGLGLCSWLSWNVGTLLGVIGSAFLPEAISASLAISLSAMFIALVVPRMKKSVRICLLVALTALLSWLFRLFLDSSLSTICSILLASWLGTYFIPKEDLQ
ncbi:AzlC family ABC transporter permease [Allobaculum mucilyticum]|uniref:AzlC family ABC transporter permease n=1 Tax=Allobaculum mucilyticum TaxID=2834459 RepID=UPI001E57E62A|nr:AzlC family ABC transporter permease [Allobaculum mucilyticum]UNT96105.1 AzlC family ABC transporter permease [Allobaculum mucilyticum]